MDYIDVRSDTVTQPTPEMREAMARAAVGDDVYGDDPTVNRLQELAADMLGKPAALFVPSGTMGNLVSILAHCQRGAEAIVGKENHTFLHEAGGLSVLGGVHSAQLANQPDGSLALAEIEAAIREDDAHEPVTRLICLENSHNHCGGTVQTPEYTRQVAALAQARGLKVHLDGARLFNAATALGVPARELTAPVDSVMFCLSKGLCAPVGSLVCGSREFIHKAHRLRKMLGGGMRQAGILAAAGMIALQKMTLRLGEDHARARALAEALKGNPQVVLDAGTPVTNMVYFNLAEQVGASVEQIKQKLKAQGILANEAGPRRFRLVTHYWIDDRAVERTADAFKQALQ